MICLVRSVSQGSTLTDWPISKTGASLKRLATRYPGPLFVVKEVTECWIAGAIPGDWKLNRLARRSHDEQETEGLRSRT